MASRYVEEYAKSHGITVAEAMEHAIVKEYLKDHPANKPEEYHVTKTTMVAGCGSAGSMCGCDS